jgi:hypothetical protein
VPLQRPNLSTTYIYRPLLAVSLGAILPCELASCTNRTVIVLWMSWRRMTRALCGTMWERLPTCGVPTNHLLMIYGPLLAVSLGAILPCELASCTNHLYQLPPHAPAELRSPIGQLPPHAPAELRGEVSKLPPHAPAELRRIHQPSSPDCSENRGRDAKMEASPAHGQSHLDRLEGLRGCNTLRVAAHARPAG